MMPRLRLLATALGSLLATPVLAQDSWQSEVALYGWFPGLASEVETPLGTVSSEASFSDILDRLDMAFMGAVQLRHGRWSFLGDLIYTDLSEGIGLPAGLPGGLPYRQADVSAQVTAFSAYALYDAVSRPDFRLGLGLGLRAVSADTTIRLSQGAPVLQFTGEDEWIDPVIAARLVWSLDARWFSTVLVDYGGGDATWQALATVGYRIDDRWTVQAGYRHMTVEHDLGDSLPVAFDLGGPLIGFSYRF